MKDYYFDDFCQTFVVNAESKKAAISFMKERYMSKDDTLLVRESKNKIYFTIFSKNNMKFNFNLN